MTRFRLKTKLLAMVSLPLVASFFMWASAHSSQAHTNELHARAMLWAEDARAAQHESLVATRYLAEVSRIVFWDEVRSREAANALAIEVIAAGKSSEALARAFGPEEVEEEAEIRNTLSQLMDVAPRALDLVGVGRRAEARQLFAEQALPLRDKLLVDLHHRVEEEIEGSHHWRQRANEAADAQSRLGLLVALGSTLILVPSLVSGRHIQRGLESLQRGVRRIAAQDFSRPVEVDGQDELAELAAGFNQMAAALAHQREVEIAGAAAQARVEAAEESRAELARLVAERTAELAAANEELRHNLITLHERDARMQASERLAAIGTMAAGIAHEINNPLGYVVSSLAFAMEEFEELATGSLADEETRAPRCEELLRALSEAKEGANRVGSIVKDMKALSRSDKQDLLGRINLNECLEAACTIAGSELKKRSRLVRQLGECPPVRASTSKLGQVFLNLLINAGQAVPAERAGVVTVASHTGPGGEAIVEISDNGIGIPESVGKRIFDAFFTTKPTGEGTGLGLSICHSIVSSLGGKIEFESAAGEGTTFRVTLPASPCSEEDADPTPASSLGGKEERPSEPN